MQPTQITTLSADEPTSISQDSIVQTGKRVRKKNPRYDDMIRHDITSKHTKKSGGRPRKRKKLNPQPDKELFVLSEKKKTLEQEVTIIKRELLAVKKNLHDAHVQAGLPLPTDLINYDELDDMDYMDQSTDTPYEPPGTKKRTPTKGSRRGTPSSRGKRKSTPRSTRAATPKKLASTKNTSSPKVPRPRRRSKAPSEPLLSSEFNACRNVLDQLMAHQYAPPFNVPVDPEALGIPDYPLVIKNPMDFGTARKKLNGNEYATVEDFATDIELIFNNACTYNSPSSDVFVMAETLRRIFTDKKRLLSKPLNGPDTPARNLRTHTVRENNPPVTPPSPRRTRKDNTNRPLTKEEKQKLSIGIKGLNSTQLTVVVQIIKEKLPELTGDKEIVIDIDSLDTMTLRSLQKFVSSVSRKKKKSSKRRVAHMDPVARLELVKLTEQGMQSKIESVQRQLEELSANKGANSVAKTKVEPVSSVHSRSNSDPADVTNEDEAQTIVPTSDRSGSDSESGSDESDSDSDDSASDTDMLPTLEETTAKTVVETVIAPVLQNTLAPDFSSSAPRIIATSPTVSEVKADNIENVASWAQLAAQKDESTTPQSTSSFQSANGSHLWSSMRDSHAQLKQKEQEQILHKEKLQKEKEEKEAELLRLEEEKRQKAKEEEKEAKLRVEQEMEEARQKAKRDRKQKVEENTDSADLYFGNIPIPGSGIMSKVDFSNIRSSLQSLATPATAPVSEDPAATSSTDSTPQPLVASNAPDAPASADTPVPLTPTSNTGSTTKPSN